MSCPWLCLSSSLQSINNSDGHISQTDMHTYIHSAYYTHSHTRLNIHAYNIVYEMHESLHVNLSLSHCLSLPCCLRSLDLHCVWQNCAHELRKSIDHSHDFEPFNDMLETTTVTNPLRMNNRFESNETFGERTIFQNSSYIFFIIGCLLKCVWVICYVLLFIRLAFDRQTLPQNKLLVVRARVYFYCSLFV